MHIVCRHFTLYTNTPPPPPPHIDPDPDPEPDVITLPFDKTFAMANGKKKMNINAVT